ncbi:MAG: ABC transporter ATP-binding protein, partial [Angustibacter sp.]
EILAGIGKIGGGTTVLVMAFRKATIALADEVIVLRQGEIIDRGEHQRLISRNKHYADIVHAYERQAVELAEARTAVEPMAAATAGKSTEPAEGPA